MSFILGIDTGGTYTDGVIIDSADRSIICKAKALTTKNDLSEGIKNCLSEIDFDRLNEIEMVSLSTTLATNAVVEGRGAKVGLIYMGADLDEDVPAEMSVKVRGRFDIMGRLAEDIDADEVKQVIADMKGRVDAVAVSGYASVRNPKHEQEIKRIADELLGIPIVCGHQLTSALGFHHRTVTAVLNGRLIPVIDRLLKAVGHVLAEYGINAPVMIVKGDGTLMTEKMAKEKPIDTILSGPSASVIGGLALTGRKDGLVIDMGGTTTDIADVTDGRVKINRSGARVGGWFTRVMAAEISTFGIGGDSRICLDRKGRIKIGPEKVCPLCVAGSRYPQLIHEMKSFRRAGEVKTYSSQEADCFMLAGGKPPVDIERWEEKIIDRLLDGPHSLTYLAKVIGRDPETVDLTRLVRAGVLERISVTPTDILHVNNRYSRWNRELSQAGIDILARRKEISSAGFTDMAEKAVNAKLAMSCVQSAADFEGEELSFEDAPQAMYLIERAFGIRSSDILKPSFHLRKPVVAIGAPAEAWVTQIEKLLDAEVIVPHDADVANAYGAAAGCISEKVELMISPDGNGYILNAPWQRMVYDTRDEAMFYAVHEGRKHIEHLLMAAGCSRWKIDEETDDMYAEIRGNEGKTYTGTRMIITGTGNLI